MNAPFFIVGSARSGTTLLRMILNAHPDVAVPPESRFVVELYEGRDDVDVDGVLRVLGDHPRFRLWELDIDSVRSELDGTTHAPFADVMSAAYAAYAHEHGKKVWGDKTPRYVEDMELLGALWPHARFVHLVRDGRNVALSYADVPFGPKTVGAAAGLWSERVEKGRAGGVAVWTSRYLQMRYEDLVDDLKANVGSLCDFLEITFDERMLSYAERSGKNALERAKHYNPNVMRPPQKDIRSWEESMPPSHVETFEAVAGKTLSVLGYPRSYARPGIVARLEGALGKAGLPVGRLRSVSAAQSDDPAFDEDE